MRQLQLVLYFAACLLHESNRRYFNADALATIKGDDCKEPIGNWCKMSSEWISNRPVGRTSFLTATYRRSDNGLTRILIYGGVSLRGDTMTDSWIYCPTTNSWTPVTPPKPSDPTRLFSSPLKFFSFVTLSSAQVILLRLDSNATWLFNLFDGTRETWVSLSIPLPYPPTRASYSVSAAPPSDKSPRLCKNSVFLYGGCGYKACFPRSSHYLNDLWELRCVNDDVMQYKWINIKQRFWSSWPPGLRNHFSFSTNSDLYIFSANTSSEPSHNVWRYHLRTGKWALYDAVDFSNFSPYYSGVFLKHLGVMILIDRTTALFYDVVIKKYFNLEINYSGGALKWPTHDDPNDFLGGVAVAENNVFVIGPCSNCDYLSTWKMNTKAVADGRNRRSISKVLFDEVASPLLSPGSIASKPVVLSNFLFYNNVDDSNYNYWRLDLKSNMWTLYDHDRLPDLSTAAVSAFGNDSIVAFAKDKLRIYEVWIYMASLRLWNEVKQIGIRRPPSRQYSTLTAMQDRSLILYGSDSDSTELWILNVSLSAMTATWYRPRQHGNQIILDNLRTGPHFSNSYAAVVDDDFYVYGGYLRNVSSCSMNLFSVNISNNSAPWNVVHRFGPSGGCVWNSATIGRYMFFIRQNSKNLRIVDLLRPFDADQELQNEDWPREQDIKYLTSYENKLVTSFVYRNLDGTSSWSLYSLQKGCTPGSYSKRLQSLFVPFVPTRNIQRQTRGTPM